MDAVRSTIVQALADYRKEVADRRRVTSSDPVADTFAFVVDDLQERLARAEKAAERLTPEAYAALPHVGVTAQAVRTWCRHGELPGAEHTERGWKIPRDAKRVRGARRAPRVA